MKLTIKSIPFFCLTIMGQVSVAVPIEGEVELLLRNHHSLQAQQYLVEAADQGIIDAKSGFLPSVDLSSTIQQEHINPAGSGSSSNLTSKNATVTVRQNLYSGYSNQSKTNIALLDYKTQQLGLEKTKQDLLLTAVNAYVDVLKQSSLLEIAKNNESALIKYLQFEQDRHQYGAGLKADILQSKIRLQLAKDNLTISKNSLENAMTHYAEVFDHQPELTALDSVLLPEAFIPENLTSAIVSVSEFNPSLKLTHVASEKAKAKIELEKSAFSPNIDVVGSSSWSDDSDGVEGLAQDTAVGVQLQWNLFNGHSTTAKRNIAGKEYSSSLANHDNNRSKAEEQVRLAWESLDKNKQRLLILDNAVKTAKDLLEMRKKLRAVGENTAKNVLDARSEYFNAQVLHTTSKYDFLLNHFSLLHAIGLLTQDTIASKMKRQAIKPNQTVTVKTQMKASESESVQIKAPPIKAEKIVKATPKLSEENALLGFPADHYVIQLLAVRGESSFKGVASDLNLQESKTHYYTVKFNDQDLHVMTYGSFSSYQLAVEAVRDLPSEANISEPWIRKLTTVQAEIKRGYK